MGDDAQAVVFEVSQAVSSALDEFHFSVVAFGDAVVAAEAPHPHDFFFPVFQGLAEGFHGLESTVLEFLKQTQQLVDGFFAGLFVERLEFEQ